VGTNVPDIAMEMTGSGSMTQEIFMVYVNHFVSNLQLDHGPVILFFRWTWQQMEQACITVSDG